MSSDILILDNRLRIAGCTVNVVSHHATFCRADDLEGNRRYKIFLYDLELDKFM